MKVFDGCKNGFIVLDVFECFFVFGGGIVFVVFCNVICWRLCVVCDVFCEFGIVICSIYDCIFKLVIYVWIVEFYDFWIDELKDLC